MSTRSITHIHEMTSLGGDIVCSFYRHSDGYPSGHGRDLLQWLKDKNLVNGISSGFRDGIDFNRAGTMAVKLMNHIQDESGCEVIPTGSSDCGEEYIYHIGFDKGIFFLGIERCYDKQKVILKATGCNPDALTDEIFEEPLEGVEYIADDPNEIIEIEVIK